MVVPRPFLKDALAWRRLGRLGRPRIFRSLQSCPWSRATGTVLGVGHSFHEWTASGGRLLGDGASGAGRPVESLLLRPCLGGRTTWVNSRGAEPGGRVV